ncbi:MAG TPA: hypothetical protein VGV87_06275 [Blastocatellia bacterium]|jgi:hypothetical protein|nr:hypothetical protein [Blastocatellia bacterium]
MNFLSQLAAKRKVAALSTPGARRSSVSVSPRSGNSRWDGGMIRARQDTVKDGSNRLVIEIAKGGGPSTGPPPFMFGMV